MRVAAAAATHVSVAAASAAVICSCWSVWAARHRLADAARRVRLRWRARGAARLLHELRSHAAALRRLSEAPGASRAVRSAQTRALIALKRGREAADASLLELHASLTGMPADAALVPRLTPRAHAALRALASRLLASRREAERALETAPRAWWARLLRRGPPDPLNRDAMLGEERNALRSLRGSAAQPGALARAVRLLRKLEASVDFQAELLAEQIAHARTDADPRTAYTRENFAYGSTPLHAYLTLTRTCAPLAEAVGAAEGAKVVVLGSSLGWLCFYFAAVHGARAHGIEILPSLVRHAEGTAAAARIDGATFECADILGPEVGPKIADADVVVLTSQCWDVHLRERVKARLLQRMKVDALAVDYTPRLGDDDHTGRRFALAATAVAPVSWDAGLTFHVCRVEEAALKSELGADLYARVSAGVGPDGPRVLNLQSRGVDDAKLGAICRALSARPAARLHELLLGDNNISDAGLVELARALDAGGAPALRDIELWGNEVGDVGAAALAAALARGRALADGGRLCMAMNPRLGASGRAAVEAACAARHIDVFL